MIKPSTIDKVRSLPIEDVVGRYVELKKGKACCPIHNEKTPSLSVRKSTNKFKCFGCGAGGDDIEFVMQATGQDFIGAVEEIAKQFNISVEYERGYNAEQVKEQRAERQSDNKLMTIAVNYFVQSLSQNEEALQYLKEKRGYTQDIIDEWRLGYAPAQWRGLTNKMQAANSLGAAERLSLIKEKDDQQYRDFFFNKIMFPIADANGQVISFGARVMDSEQWDGPKYLNGSQTHLYNKSATLFGLDKAIPHIRKKKFGVLVEGYTDVISMHAAGVNNTVGVCGSELTQDHARILARYADHWIVIPDNDFNPEEPDKTNTGFNKVAQKLELLIAEGVHVELYELEPQQDPDDLAKEFFNKEKLATT